MNRDTQSVRIGLFDGTSPEKGYWSFDSHYWLNVDGEEYDALFNENFDNSDWVQ
jgi:hypothetical protein